MKNRYEALLVLNTQGREDTVKDVVDRLESEFQKEGAEIEQVQKMDKRQFSYVAGELDAGHQSYVGAAGTLPRVKRSKSSKVRWCNTYWRTSLVCR